VELRKRRRDAYKRDMNAILLDAGAPETCHPNLPAGRPLSALSRWRTVPFVNTSSARCPPPDSFWALRRRELAVYQRGDVWLSDEVLKRLGASKSAAAVRDANGSPLAWKRNVVNASGFGVESRAGRALPPDPVSVGLAPAQRMIVGALAADAI